MEQAIRAARDDVFLENHLDTVGGGLPKAKEGDGRARDADFVGADAVLDSR